MIDSIPLYSEDLIKELDRAVPLRLPKMDESEREIFAYRGRRQLIFQLLEKLNESAERETEEGSTRVQC